MVKCHHNYELLCLLPRFMDICNYQNRSDLMKLMISSLDFSHDHASQVVLSKVLTCTEKEMRLYATRHLRVLLRAKMPFFTSWGLELLVTQVRLIWEGIFLCHSFYPTWVGVVFNEVSTFHMETATLPDKWEWQMAIYWRNEKALHVWTYVCVCVCVRDCMWDVSVWDLPFAETFIFTQCSCKFVVSVLTT